MTNLKLKIASRRSKLAMVQTLWVKDQLEKNIPNLEVSIEAMATQGDKILDVALAKIGDKGLFTKELEAQMLVGHADIAVHSLKDLPTNLPSGLELGCITKREDPADALVVSKKNECYKLETLPKGSIVGTSSLRRLAQLRNKYPHLVFKDIRGNVITRIEKLDAGEFDCIILAAAGLKRLGFESRIHQIIPNEISLHAVGQGALGIECKSDDKQVLEIINVLKKIDESFPNEVILVLDATTGQNAMNQVEEFSKIHNLTGLIITKLDSTAKGGVVLAICKKYNLPIVAIGMGEKEDDLQPFNAEYFSKALLGIET